MALAFTVVYHNLVVAEDIPALTSAWRDAIRTAIEEKLMTHPDVYGKPLRRSLKGYRKLRVGDYRAVFRISGITIFIIAILHRSVVYRQLKRRLQ